MKKLLLSALCALSCTGAFASDDKHPSDEVYDFYMLSLSKIPSIEGECDHHGDAYKYADAVYQTTTQKVELYLNERKKYTLSKNIINLDLFALNSRVGIYFVCNGDSYDINPESKGSTEEAFIIADRFIQ